MDLSCIRVTLPPVSGQPQTGSCWTIGNAHLWVGAFQPQGSGWHPVACVQAKGLKTHPTLQSVPRTTDPDHGERNDDERAVYSRAYCTPGLDKNGWFLARFQKPIRRALFMGFSASVFKGQLPDDDLKELRRVCELPTVG